MVVKITDSVVTTLDHLTYSGSGDVALSGRGTVIENNTQKATFDFTVPRGGDPQFNFNKTNSDS
jgi:hypothetical protein